MPLTDSIAKVGRSLALISVERGEETGYGTGFVAGRNGEVLTCAHILRDARTVEATIVGAKAPARCTVLETDLEADAALLRVEARDLAPVSLWRGSSIALGREVAFMGFPHSDIFSPPLVMTMRGIVGNRYRISSGAAKGKGPNPGIDYYIVDASASEGMSGGPLFLADTGEVIGIVGGRFDPGRTRAKLRGESVEAIRERPAERTNIAFAAAIEYAVALLKKRS